MIFSIELIYFFIHIISFSFDSIVMVKVGIGCGIPDLFHKNAIRYNLIGCPVFLCYEGDPLSLRRTLTRSSATSLRSVPRGGVRMVQQDHEDAEEPEGFFEGGEDAAHLLVSLSETAKTVQGVRPLDPRCNLESFQTTFLPSEAPTGIGRRIREGRLEK